MAKTKLKPIEIEDLLTYCYPSSLAYAPDGKTLAFTLTKPNGKTNGYDRSVWMIRNGKAEQMTFSPSATFVIWDDNETMVVRRTAEDSEPGMTDLFRLSVNGGEAKPWMSLPFAMTALHKIDVDLYLAEGTIHADDPDAYKDSKEVKEEKRKKAEEEKDYQVIDEVPYWHNGAGFTNKERNALFLIHDGEKRSIKRVTEPFESASSITVHNHDVYYFSETHTLKESRNADIHLLHADTGRKEKIYTKKDLGFSRLFVMHDELYGMASRRLEHGLNETPDFVKIEKNKVTFLVDPHRRLNAGIAGDTMLGGGSAFRMYNDEMYTVVTDVDHVGVRKYDGSFNGTDLFAKAGAVYFLDVCDGHIAFAYEDASAPTEIYEMDLDGSNVHKLTDLNSAAVEGKYVALPELVETKSEGWDLRGWVLKPINYDAKKKYPAVLDIHGGPRSIYGEIFFHEMQAWASKGYFVFFANICGSDGRDDEFGDICGKYGTVDYQNLMDFTDKVLELYPAIDQEKLCVTGGSYGGFMTNWIIGQTDRFCAAASQRSIASWISLTFIADIGLWFDPGECGIPIGDSIFDHFDKLWAASPLKNAKGIKTPTLFIHSDNDFRCPLPEGMQMMQALAYQNVETRMCIFHGENHELSRGGKPLHRIRRIKEITDWFDKHTGRNAE